VATRTIAAPASVLVYVNGDLVGDGVMKLPFVRALRHSFPAARITWLAGIWKSAYAHQLAPLVQGLIDEVIEEAGADHPYRWVARRPMNGRRFDLIIDTQRAVLTSLLVRRIRHRYVISGAADFLLSDIRPKSGYQRPKAMVAQMLDLLVLATGRPAESIPVRPLDSSLAAAAAARLPLGPTYVGLAPGAGGRHKCWPLESFIALAQAQVVRGRMPVFLLGPQESALLEPLMNAVPQALFPASQNGVAAGVCDSPVLTVALAARLAVGVANDAGAGHMIAAAGIPLVSLFGPTSPEKFAPTAKRLTVLRAQSFGGEAMAAIPVEAVIAAVDDALAARP